jgi:hypothetical protein
VNEIKFEQQRQDILTRIEAHQTQIQLGQAAMRLDHHAQVQRDAHDRLELAVKHGAREQRDAYVRIEQRQEYQIKDKDRGTQSAVSPSTELLTLV